MLVVPRLPTANNLCICTPLPVVTILNNNQQVCYRFLHCRSRRSVPKLGLGNELFFEKANWETHSRKNKSYRKITSSMNGSLKRRRKKKKEKFEDSARNSILLFYPLILSGLTKELGNSSHAVKRRVEGAKKGELI